MGGLRLPVLAKRHRNPSHQGALLDNQELGGGAEVMVRGGRKALGKDCGQVWREVGRVQFGRKKGELEKPR